MYVPTLYRCQDSALLLEIAQTWPLATLASVLEGQPWLSQVPTVTQLVDEEWRVAFHLATSNPQSAGLAGQRVTLLFQGPRAYISPRWYDHENVPTYNYISLQLKGLARPLPVQQTEAHLAELVTLQEGAGSGYQYAGLSRPLVEDHLPGLLAFELDEVEAHGVLKLSQNRHDADYRTIIGELEKQGDESAVLAQWMRRLRPSV